MIVPGSTSQVLAAELAAELDEPLAAVEYDRFPDGELLAAAPGFAAEREGGGSGAGRTADGSTAGRAVGGSETDRAVVVASTTTSDAHVELLQLQDAVREAGAEEVVTVLPYMGYARQDEAFEAGHPISARAVARAIGAGTDRVVTVNPHEDAVCEFFGVPAEPVDAAGRLADPLPADLADPVFLAPDDGAIGIAETVRDAYGAGSTDYFEKTRLSGEEVEIRPSDVDVGGRDVVVTDDIVATGSTMAESVGVLDDRGARDVYVTAIHAVLARDALTKLRRAGVEAIHATDTVERPVSDVSVAPTLAAAIGR